MKLVSCFRGLDCLSLRHLDNEKPTTIFWSKKKSKKLWSGLLFLGFYCSIQWRKILLEVTPEIFEHQKSLRSLQCSDRCWKKQPMLKKRTTDGHMGSRNFFDAEKKNRCWKNGPWPEIFGSMVKKEPNSELLLSCKFRTKWKLTVNYYYFWNYKSNKKIYIHLRVLCSIMYIGKYPSFRFFSYFNWLKTLHILYICT